MATTSVKTRNYNTSFGNGPVNDPIKRKNAGKNVNAGNTGKVDNITVQELTVEKSSKSVELQTTDTAFPSFFVPTKCQTSENAAFPNVITALKELSTNYASVAGSLAALTLCNLFTDSAQANIAQNWSDEEIANIQEMVATSAARLGFAPANSTQENDSSVSESNNSVTSSTSSASSSSELSNASIVSMMMEMITIIYSLLQKLEAEQRAMQLQSSVDQQDTANKVAKQVVDNAVNIRNQQQKSARQQLTGAWTEFAGAGASTTMTVGGVVQDARVSSLEHGLDVDSAVMTKANKDVKTNVDTHSLTNAESTRLQNSSLFNRATRQVELDAINDNSDPHLLGTKTLIDDISPDIDGNEANGIHADGTTGNGPRALRSAVKKVESAATNNAANGGYGVRLNAGTHSGSAIDHHIANSGIVSPTSLSQADIDQVNGIANVHLADIRPFLKTDGVNTYLAHSVEPVIENNITTERTLVLEPAVAGNHAHPDRIEVRTRRIDNTNPGNPEITHSITHINKVDGADPLFDALAGSIDNRKDSLLNAASFAASFKDDGLRDPNLEMTVTTFDSHGNRYDVNNRYIDDQNRFCRDDGRLLDANSNLVNEAGEFVNEDGDLVDEYGDHMYPENDPANIAVLDRVGVRTNAPTAATVFTSPLAFSDTNDLAVNYNVHTVSQIRATKEAGLLIGTETTNGRDNDGLFSKFTAATREGMMGQGGGSARQRLAEYKDSNRRWQNGITSGAQLAMAFGRAIDGLYKERSQVTSSEADFDATGNNQLQSTMKSLLEFMAQIISNEGSNISTLMQTLTSFMKTALDATISAQSIK